MHGDFLQDLAVVMIAAGLVTVLAHVLKQPVVLGYIIAGFLIGPHTPGQFVHNEETINLLSELGIILLMFSLGMHFSLRKLFSVGRTALVAGILEILLMGWIGYTIGRFFGWSNMDSIFMGACLSMSSTTIITKVLGEMKRLHEPFAQLMFGVLIIEDILGIAMIALLSGLAVTGEFQADTAVITLGQLMIFLVVVLVVGLLVVPRLIHSVARFQSSETLLVAVLGLCFGVTLLAAKMGYSVALGSFLIGAVIAECREHMTIEILIEPVRDMFSAVFFVAVGMLINPDMLVEYWLPIVLITAAVIVGKVIACSFGTFVTGHDTRTSLRVGMGLAQIGEFSFIIAQLGLTLNKTSEFLYPIAVMVSAITTLLTPYLIRGSDGAVTLFERVAPRPLLNMLDLYNQWAGRPDVQAPNIVRQVVRKTILQISINLALVAGLFFTAPFVARWLDQQDIMPSILGGTNTIIWLATMLLSLPILLATFRKLRAMSMLLAELIVSRNLAGQHVSFIRGIVSNIMLGTGTAGLALLVLVLSAAIQPPIQVVFALGLIIVGIAILKWRSFIRIYARGQSRLEDVLRESPPPPRPEPPPPPMPPLLRHAELELVEIDASSPAGGKLIRELNLRAKTGASVVAIERDSQSIVNPGPDVEILAGDKLLLLGNAEQLQSSRQMLVGSSSVDSSSVAAT